MNSKKLRITIPILLLLLAAVFAASLLLGSVNLSLRQIADGFAGTDKTARIILRELRLPRVIAAMLAGAGLSTAGFLLQTITDNKLCAPNIIGVNAGAGFAVMLLTCLFPMQWRLLPVASFAGAVLTAFLVLGVSGVGGKVKKTTIVLAGVAVSALLNSGISFLSLRYPEALPSYVAFSVGGFSGVKPDKLVLPAVIIAGSFTLAMMFAAKMQLLTLGDDTASGLGVRVKALRMTTIILAAALAASVVSFAGLIGFVGLVIPHIGRKLAGESLRAALPVSALCGMILVMLSDLAGRTLFSPGEIPAGIFLAIIGAPFFLWLLTKRRNSL